MRKSKFYSLIIIMLIPYLGLRIWAITEKQIPHIDGMSTLNTISGSGIENNYQLNQQINIRQWQSVNKLNRIAKKNKVWNFSGVSKKLKLADGHPPLYFWIAHAWCSVFGFGTGQLMALQLVFELLILVLLGFYTSLFIKKDTLFSVILITCILIHPSCIESLIVNRKYHLLALLTLALVIITLKLQSKSWHSIQLYVLLSASIFLGFITHYSFPIIVFCLGISVIVTSNNSIKSLLKPALIVLITGCFTVFFFNDYFSMLLEKSQSFKKDSPNLWHYVLGLPLRFLLPKGPFLAIPLWIKPFSFVAVFAWFYQTTKNSHNRILKLFVAFSTIYLVVLAILLSLQIMPLHSITENRYSFAFILLIIPAVFLSFNTHKSKHILISSLALIFFGISSFRLFGQPTLQRANANKHLIIAKSQSDIRRLMSILPPDDFIMILRHNNNIDLRHIDACTVYWPHYKLLSAQKKFYLENHGLRPLEGNYAYPAFELKNTTNSGN